MPYTDNKFSNKHVYENSPIYFIPIPMYQDEVFLDIKNDLLVDYYMVSNYGRVFNKYGNYFIQTFISNNGYEKLSLMKKEFGSKNYNVHRLVMETFEPVHDEEKCFVNHINGIKTDNRYSNLEWCTPSYNSKDGIMRGLREKGENFTRCRINLEQAHQICQLIQDTDYSATQISDMIGGNCTPDIVAGIMKGRNWQGVAANYKFRPRNYSQVLNDEMVHAFCKYFEDNPKVPGVSKGEYCEQACIDLGYQPMYRLVNALITVYSRRNWKHVVSQYNF